MAGRGRNKAAHHLELHHARRVAEQLQSDHFPLSSQTAAAALFHELQSAATTTSTIHSNAAARSSQSSNGTMPALSLETTLTPSSLGLVQMFGQETDSIHVVTVTVAADDITALTTAAPTASELASVVATTDQGSQESRTANQDQQVKPSDDAWKAAVIIVCTLTALSVAGYFIYRIWKKRQSRKSTGAQRIGGGDKRDVAARPRTRTSSYANRPPTPFRPFGPAAGAENPKGPSSHGASFWSPQRNHPNSHAFPDFPPPMGLPRSLGTHGRPALEPVGIANAMDSAGYGYAVSTGNGFPAAQTQSTIVASDEGMMYPPGQGKIYDDVLNAQQPQDGHGRAAASYSTFANDASVATTAAASEDSSYFPYNEQGFYVSPVQKRFPPSPGMSQQQPFHFDSQGSTNPAATSTTAPALNSFASTSPGHGLKRQSMDDNGMASVITGPGPFVFRGDTDRADAAADADDKTEMQDQPPAKKPRLADEANEAGLNGGVDGKSPTAVSHHGSVSSRTSSAAARVPTPCPGCFVPGAQPSPRLPATPFGSVGSAGHGTPVHARARPATATGASMPVTPVSRPGTPVPRSRVCSF